VKVCNRRNYPAGRAHTKKKKQEEERFKNKENKALATIRTIRISDTYTEQRQGI